MNAESILEIRTGATSDRQVLDLCAVGSHRIRLTCPENNLRPRRFLFTLYRGFPLFLCEGMLMLITSLFSTVYEIWCIYVCVLSRVQLFATPWPVACQASLSIGFSRPEILEWVAISSSSGSSWPRDQTCISCITGGFFITEPPKKPFPMNRTEQSKAYCSYHSSVRSQEVKSSFWNGWW